MRKREQTLREIEIEIERERESETLILFFIFFQGVFLGFCKSLKSESVIFAVEKWENLEAFVDSFLLRGIDVRRN